MVLDHVADCSSLIVKPSAALNPEVFRHRNLDALDVVAVPKRFHKCVGEAESQYVVDRALTQVVVDSEDIAFVKSPKQNPVQFLSRCEVVAERFLHDDSRSPSAVRRGQMLDDGLK